MNILCERCSQIFRGSCPHGEQDHYYSVRELERAAFDKCYICRVLWQAILDRAPDDVRVNSKPISKYRMRHKVPYTDEISELSFVVDQNGVLNGGRSFLFCLQNTSDGHKLLGKSGSALSLTWDKSMDIATEWLLVCQRDHRNCTTTISPDRYIPKRLLSISRSDPKKVQLVIDPGLQLGQIRYATLSHCWGSSKPLTLTSNSLATLRAGIEIAKLPQVFQDAIYTIKCLGIQFIWIDSLCIFQDSKDDWAQQAPQMSHVYRNGAINIAMSAAANSNETCFLDRDLSRVIPCIVQTKWDRCPNDEFHIYYNEIWENIINSTPLSKRAWVVQELLLPSRILHLTGQQLFWECFELTACETYPGGLPRRNKDNWMPRETIWQAFNCASDDIQAIRDITEPLAENEFRKLWTAIVKMFTGRDLTVTSDRLIALAGIAKVMGQALNDEYCAGLWQRNLAVELNWYPPGSRGLEPRPSGYRAPSWSWATLDGQCSPAFFADDETTDRLIRIIECHVDTATNDPFGFVNAGTLTLCGWLATIRLKPRRDSAREWSVFFNGSWLDDRMIYIALDCVHPHLQLHCLPVILDSHQSPQWNLSCILLIATGVQKGQFQRAGILNVFSGGHAMADWAVFKTPKNEDWLEYEARCENNLYKISIV